MRSFELCEAAVEIVISAGFELRYTSRKTEARYYGFPGRYGMLRIAAHAKWKGENGLPPIVARVTVPSDLMLENGAKMPPAKLECLVAEAMGRYLIKTASTCVHTPAAHLTGSETEAPDRAALRSGSDMELRAAGCRHLGAGSSA